MKSFKKLSMLLTLGLVFLAPNKALAAPAASKQEIGTAHGSRIKSEFSALKNPETTRRQLAELSGPILAALEPSAEGIDQGITAGAGNVNAASSNAGEAVNQAAQGAGGTLAEVPGAADRTVHNVEEGGLAGDVVTTLTGAPPSAEVPK